VLCDDESSRESISCLLPYFNRSMAWHEVVQAKGFCTRLGCNPAGVLSGGVGTTVMIHRRLQHRGVGIHTRHGLQADDFMQQQVSVTSQPNQVVARSGVT